MEQDLVLLSLVRSKGDSVGFIKNFKRLNVALTRAKFGLIIVGDARHISQNTKSDDFRDLINFYRAKKSFIDVDNLKELFSTWFGDQKHKYHGNSAQAQAELCRTNLMEKNQSEAEDSSSEIEEGEIVLDIEAYGQRLTSKR